MRFNSNSIANSPGLLGSNIFHGDPSATVDAPFEAAEWCSWATRTLRYKIYWSMYVNDLYRQISSIGFDYKASYGLDRYTKGIYNAAGRLVKFHVAHVHGGRLDPEAGPGTDQPTCLPFVVDEGIRPVIAKILADSRWGIRKSKWVRYGSCLGDGPMKLRINRRKQQVKLQVFHPVKIEWLERDDDDRVTAYSYVEMRDAMGMADMPGIGFAVYREIARLDPITGDVRFQTFRARELSMEGEPFDWEAMQPGGRNSWTIRGLGTCPLWSVSHGETDLPFGQSELEIGRLKMDSINDLASKLRDQCRKLVEGAWLLAGVPPTRDKPKMTATMGTWQSPEQARQEQKIIFSTDPNAKAHSLVNDIPIAEISDECRQGLMSLEDDYPELKFERLRTSGDISGEAMRTARQPASASIELIRNVYDQNLIEALRCAIRWGAIEGFKDFSSLGIDSGDDKRLMDMRIGDRPVFAVDSMDRLDEVKKRWDAVLIATQAGSPLEFALETAGFTEEDIARVREMQPMPTEQAKIDLEQSKVEASKQSAFGKASANSPTGSRPKATLV